jgi:hypothetical protein
MSLDEEQLAAGKSAADIHADELAGLAVRVGTRCATFIILILTILMLYLSVTNQWGSINQYRNDTTWNNIDF